MTRIADPVERAARIIAGVQEPTRPWSDIPAWKQDRYRRTAQAVLDDYVAGLHTNAVTEEEAGDW